MNLQPLEPELERIQIENLAFLESWGKQMPAVNGVAVCQALSYELIQVLNQLALQEREVDEVEESPNG